MKKVLILCTGNSCRSIMAEGLIKKYVPEIEVFSAGTKPTGFVVDGAERILKLENINIDDFRSKSVDEVEKFAPFDLVVTLCDGAKESCPSYPYKKKQIHLPIEDPFLKPFSQFKESRDIIKNMVIPTIKRELNL